MDDSQEDADLCECVVRGHHDDDDDECPAKYEREDGSVLMCTRPEGHNGPHSACNVQQHPIEVWDEEVEA